MSIVIVIVIVAAVGYYISLRLHPLSKCKACSGGGRHWGTVYTYAYQRCPKCGGSGRADRLGTRLFLGGTGGTGETSKR
jgi:DnaJ-class molecular chaperone